MTATTYKLLTHTATAISKPLPRSTMDWLQNLHWIGGGECATAQVVDSQFWANPARHRARWVAFHAVWMTEARAAGLSPQDAEFLWNLTGNLASEQHRYDIAEGLNIAKIGMRNYSCIGVYYPRWADPGQGAKHLARAQDAFVKAGWSVNNDKSLNDKKSTDEERTYNRIQFATHMMPSGSILNCVPKKVRAFYDHVTVDGHINLTHLKRMRRIL